MITTLKEDIRDLLTVSTGPVNALTVKELADILEIKIKHETGVNLRNYIRELIEEGHPIASCDKGYYYVDSLHDLRNYLTNLDKRIKGIKERKKNMIKAYVASRKNKSSIRQRCIDLVHDIAESYGMHYSSVYMLAYRMLEKQLDMPFLKCDHDDCTFDSILSRLESKGFLGQFYDTLVIVEDMLI